LLPAPKTHPFCSECAPLLTFPPPEAMIVVKKRREKKVSAAIARLPITLPGRYVSFSSLPHPLQKQDKSAPARLVWRVVLPHNSKTHPRRMFSVLLGNVCVPIDCYQFETIALLLFCLLLLLLLFSLLLWLLLLRCDVTMAGVDDARKNECGVYVCARCSLFLPFSSFFFFVV